MKKRVLCLLLSFVMALGLVPGMCLTAYAENQLVSYLDWDEAEKKLVKKNCTDYSVVDDIKLDWRDGWYVVNHDVTTSSYFVVSGTAHLILCDGATLTADSILVEENNSLIIHGQEGGSGTLVAGPSSSIFHAGIGGSTRSHANGGTVTINGGIVKAVGKHGGAGIGGGEGGHGGTVIINGGSVDARSPVSAGLGGGKGGSGGTVTVNGGSVHAFGAYGIGAGGNATGGTFSISGGEVTAIGGGQAIHCEAKNSIAGIGWTDLDGTAGKARIEPSSGGQSLDYRKVQFPAAIASVSAQPAANENLTYNGAAQALVTAGTASGGKMVYALGANDSTAPTDGWSESIPAATDAKTNYYVWYKAEGDAAHLDSDAACIPVSIGKADLTIAANRQEYIYNGQTQGEGDTVYADPAQIAEKVTVTGLKNGDQLANITLDGQGKDVREYDLELSSPAITDNEGKDKKNNYNITLVNGQLIIAQATPVISTAPVASAITCGQTLADSALTGGTASVAGSFSWKDSAAAPAVSDSQETEYPVVFTPTDRANYRPAECRVKLTVHKADSAVTKAPEAKALTWTGSAQALADAGQADGGTMLYALGTKDAAPAADAYTAAIPAAADAGTYYVWYMVKGDSNHNDTVPAGPITVTIAEVADGYSIRSVQGGEHVLGDNRDAVFTVTHIMDDNRPFERFSGVSAGGKDVAEGNYTRASGSLVLTLKSAYLNTLAAGDYPVRIAFTDGYVDSSLKILDAEPTPTETPTATPAPTATPSPTEAPTPTATPSPTEAPAPTATPKPVPKTGDSSTPLLWLCIILLAMIAGGIAVKKMKNN